MAALLAATVAIVATACGSSEDSSTGSGGTGGAAASGGAGGKGGAKSDAAPDVAQEAGGAGGTAGASGAGGGGGVAGAGGTGGGPGGAGGGPGGTGGGPGGAGGDAGPGGSGGTPAEAGPDVPSDKIATTCTWGAPGGCGAGQYCDAPGCGTGTCVPTPPVSAETDSLQPVCGCDDVTYWNASVAASHAMAVKSAGACSPGKMCGGIASIKCPPGGECAYEMPNAQMCNASDKAGTCWATPAKCPQILIGPNTRKCGAPQYQCKPRCELIKGGDSFFVDNTCPT